MTRYGTPPSTLSAVDTSLSVSADGSWHSGTSFDCKHGTDDILATYIAAQFSITGGATDGIDLEVIVQFSDDNSNWPKDGEGHPIFAYVDTGASASLSGSRVCEITPLLRYARFQYLNNNSSDSVTVDSEVAKFFMEDNS